jgi:transposase-like protein
MGKNGLLKRLSKMMIEQMLEAEMNDHLGYEKHASAGVNSGNSRNGKSSKTVKSSFGELDLDTPRDRNSEFEPVVVKKRQTDISSFDEKIISMYAKGMTTRDIQSHIKDIYGVDISPTMVSNITDKVMCLVGEWQSRQLQKIYPIVFFDAIHYKVRDEGKVASKAAYTCLGVDLSGKKEVLGIWVGESEGAHFWLGICNELKNRGVEDILIACVDGLKGFPDAINAVFPKTEIQVCIIHMIRNTMKYIGSKYQKEFMADLKLIYKAPTEDKAKIELDNLETKWAGKYPLVIKSWRKNWPNLSTYFKFPEEIRRMIYTTNAVEALHRQMRKVTKNRSIFPNDESLLKILYLAVQDVSKKWKTMALQNWSFTISQLAVIFEGRVVLDL